MTNSSGVALVSRTKRCVHSSCCAMAALREPTENPKGSSNRKQGQPRQPKGAPRDCQRMLDDFDREPEGTQRKPKGSGRQTRGSPLDLRSEPQAESSSQSFVREDPGITQALFVRDR